MSNHILAGPILGFRGLQAGHWHTSALVVLRGDANPPQLTVSIGGISRQQEQAVLLKTFAGLQVWRLEWSVQQTDHEQAVDYSIAGGETYRYVVPGQDKPLRICYGSCFGFINLKDINKLRNAFGMWKVLRRQHEQQPYHILFMGGDQVYADQLWETIQPLRDWLNKPLKKRILTPFTRDMEQEVARFYFELYCRMWGQKWPAAVMACIPTLMMWDDHDIFDGWGSYAPQQQDCAVFQGVYRQAREHFRLFQLQAQNDDDLGQATLLGQYGYTYAYRIGDLALVALDLRSERTRDQVMSLQTWNRLQAWMEEELPEKRMPDNSRRPACKHLLVMSGIPIVNVNINLLEVALEIKPGQQKIEDDLKDQWVSRAHRQERLRLIHRLLHFSKTSGCRVTLVSGDAHMAFLGYIQSDREPVSQAEANVINQLTSSAMVNLPPPALVIFTLEKIFGRKIEEVDRGITARLLRFPGTTRRIIGARNWLSLSTDEKSCIWAEWFVEGQQKPYSKVIHPVGALLSGGIQPGN